MGTCSESSFLDKGLRHRAPRNQPKVIKLMCPFLGLHTSAWGKRSNEKLCKGLKLIPIIYLPNGRAGVGKCWREKMHAFPREGIMAFSLSELVTSFQMWEPPSHPQGTPRPDRWHQTLCHPNLNAWLTEEGDQHLRENHQQEAPTAHLPRDPHIVTLLRGHWCHQLLLAGGSDKV